MKGISVRATPTITLKDKVNETHGISEKTACDIRGKRSLSIATHDHSWLKVSAVCYSCGWFYLFDKHNIKSFDVAGYVIHDTCCYVTDALRNIHHSLKEFVENGDDDDE